jgi:hypothetical protein
MKTKSLLLSVMMAFFISTGISLCQTVSNGGFSTCPGPGDNTAGSWFTTCGGSTGIECHTESQYDASQSTSNYIGEIDGGNSDVACQQISGFTAGNAYTFSVDAQRREDNRSASTQSLQVCIIDVSNSANKVCSPVYDFTNSTWGWTSVSFAFYAPASNVYVSITNPSSNNNYGTLIDNVRITRGGTPAPVTLINFNAVKNDGKVALDWQTASEKNNHYFVIEKSKDGVGFTGADTVAGSGNSTSLLSYHTTDPAPYTGTSYYRLKQVDYDRQFSYSKIVSVENDGLEINIYPNPSQGSFKIDVLSEKLSYQIEVIDAEGRPVYEGTEEPGSSLEIKGLPKGVYVVRVAGEDTVVNRKLVVL